MDWQSWLLEKQTAAATTKESIFYISHVSKLMFIDEHVCLDELSGWFIALNMCLPFYCIYKNYFQSLFCQKGNYSTSLGQKPVKTSYQEIPGLAGNHRGGRELLGQIAGGTHVVSSAARGKADSCHSNGFLGWKSRRDKPCFWGGLEMWAICQSSLLTFLEQFPENNGPFMFQPVSNRFKFGWEGVGRLTQKCSHCRWPWPAFWHPCNS